ncbi:MAG TPA: nitrogenase cofactor biosynthesis protein NifB [Candidatus Methanoculleus thermohydrogenotrophicum]|jgi:nitrogen fixation protein NifB|nr:nitrogenase cofactor biosynthesis protein NifB [Candidatus Methanoculleus thermohydrogenotrophicum]NLM82686.1 nitrogenase cofactor biosynthesis protein NifB [Candidatus Methanoculleus thermohydrogenotrophicum]HOB17702.1 nitrogenase cofactor biosynthesis protein NifB [Candidatus Methanoculleus thermohydrogenotrophicum]HPZ37941.1 nitrogenase cofactor biosynthesis protein NifB [Candidatus Methanoculleus thermohydrogenotrophicum]HQC91124.1 nitrogenase cofactor biosynthesis protein NifB [Candidat
MADESYRTATVQGREVPYDPEQLRKISEHPCYSEKACHAFGRCHLPVAPKCNIQCNYCVRDFDCVNESRPGVTSKVLSPEESLDLVRRVIKDYPYVKVIGIAGPGEPLANPETFEALRLVHEEFPHLIMCISTNGLMLPESIEELAKYDVGNVTVTLNAVDPAIGEKIYSWVEYNGKKYHGREAAELLLSQQLKGIEMAVAKKMFVKVNTVYIPGINDEHIPEIAKKVGEMGAFTFNVIPLIPQYKFAGITPPTPKEKREMQDRCAPYIKQMRHCARCRADAIGKLGQDVQSCVYQEQGEKQA